MRTNLLLALALACPGVAAEDFPPLTNLSTAARAFALPAFGALGRGPAVQLDATVSNEFEYEGFDTAGACAATECLRLDGETTRLALRMRWPVGRRGELGVELPWLWQGGGLLDDTIETWHGWFGLPNAGREQVPQDEYRYFYQRGAAVPFDVREPRDGPGDALLTLGWEPARGLMLRAAAKLPTGDEARLTGGVAGAAAWVDAELPLSGAWDAYAGAGGAWAERGGLLPGQQRRGVAFGGAGLRWRWDDTLSLHAQLYLHSGLYTGSAERALEGLGAPLSLGARLRFGPRLSLDLAVQEDLAVNVSPDFVLQSVLAWRGGG